MPDPPSTLSALDSEVRRIVTVADVTAALNSPKVSFTEALECIAVASSARDTALLRRSVTRAVADAVGRPRSSVPRSYDAAQRIARALLSVATSYEGLDGNDVGVGARALRFGIEASADKMLAERLREEAEQFDTLVLCLSDHTTSSLVTAAKTLRELGRPDLGIGACTAAIDGQEPSSVPYRVRAACYLDLTDDQADQAISPDARHGLEDAERAVSLDRSAASLRVLARAQYATKRFDDALSSASAAMDLDPSHASATILLKTALIQRDAGAANEAMRLLERPDANPIKLNQQRWLAHLAAEVHLESGDPVTALKMCEALLADGPYRPAEKVAAKARRALAAPALPFK